jgi:hypothetical protein
MKGPRWSILALGALIVVALFTYPQWRTLLRPQQAPRLFALASDAQREFLLRQDDRNAAATAYAALIITVPAPAGVPTAPGLSPLLGGRFGEINAVHRAEGRVRIYRLTDNSIIVRLEDNFAVTNAPDLVLYLSPLDAPVSALELDSATVTAFAVGPLVGSVGEQQFTIPSQLRLERYRSAVIVSDSLDIIYSYAPLS